MIPSEDSNLIDRIDYIYGSLLKNDHGDVVTYLIKSLSNQLSINYNSSIVFVTVIHASIRGAYLSKREILKFISDISSENIYKSINECLHYDYIRCYKSERRRPELFFYTTSEIDHLIINNKVPELQLNPVSKPKPNSIILVPLQNDRDYWIQLADRKIGLIYNLIIEGSNYTAVVGDDIVANSESLNEMTGILNNLLRSGKLSIPD